MSSETRGRGSKVVNISRLARLARLAAYWWLLPTGLYSVFPYTLRTGGSWSFASV